MWPDNNNSVNVYSAVITTVAIARVRPVHSVNTESALKWLPPTLKPIQPTSAVNLPVGCYRTHPPSPFIIITQPQS